MKKVIGYFFLIILVVAVLVGAYLFITKGYGGNKINPSPTPASKSLSTTPTTGDVISNKISLVVSSPQDGATLGSTNVTVTGKTVPNADVFINDQAGKANANGNFSISIGLDEGQNDIVVSANDAMGNASEVDLTVNISSFQ